MCGAGVAYYARRVRVWCCACELRAYAMLRAARGGHALMMNKSLEGGSDSSRYLPQEPYKTRAQNANVRTFSIFDLYWISNGSLLDLHWISVGFLLGLHWISIGSLLDLSPSAPDGYPVGIPDGTPAVDSDLLNHSVTGAEVEPIVRKLRGVDRGRRGIGEEGGGEGDVRHLPQEVRQAFEAQVQEAAARRGRGCTHDWGREP